MIEDHFSIYLVLIPHCMTEVLAKECKSGKSTVLVLGTVTSGASTRRIAVLISIANLHICRILSRAHGFQAITFKRSSLTKISFF